MISMSELLSDKEINSRRRRKMEAAAHQLERERQEEEFVMPPLSKSESFVINMITGGAVAKSVNRRITKQDII